MTNRGNYRFNEHKSIARSSKISRLLIQKKISQYGEDNFSFEIIYQTKDKEHCKDMEIHFISEYQTLIPFGYNIHKGGNYTTPTNKRSYEKCKQIMLTNNPGSMKHNIENKTSILMAENLITGESVVVYDRKKFAKENGMSYSGLGWSLQNNKPFKGIWKFSYVKRRNIGP